MADFEEFRKEILKVKGHRHYTVTNSLGIRQAFLFVQRNKWFNVGRALKEQQFQQIVRKVNDALAYEIMNGRPVELPQKLGIIELRKYIPGVNIVDGKLKVNYQVDWNSTLKLWAEDEEAYKNKQLMYHVTKESFRILWNRATSNCANKSFMEFKPNRSIKIMLGKNIKQGKIDAYLS